TLDLSSPSTRWSHVMPIDETEPVTIPAVPAPDFTINVWDARGVRAGVSEEFSVEAGRTTEVPLDFMHPASLVVTVTDADGAPVADVDVDVRAVGSIPGATRSSTGSDGIVMSDGWFNRTSVRVELSSTVVPLASDSSVAHLLTAG